MESEEMTQLLKTYLEPMINANIDYLVLGCSHYPYLIPQIRKIVPDHVQIIDSGRAVARQPLHWSCMFPVTTHPSVRQGSFAFPRPTNLSPALDHASLLFLRGNCSILNEDSLPCRRRRCPAQLSQACLSSPQCCELQLGPCLLRARVLVLVGSAVGLLMPFTSVQPELHSDGRYRTSRLVPG